jgi:cobalamin biosynthesis protein CobC
MHGGRLRDASAHYGIAVADWLDLSTGINPDGWPIPELPPSAWSCLPEDNDELLDAARRYYRTDTLLPVAGSQAAIQALARLHKPCDAHVIYPSYSEHAHAWRGAGHRVVQVTSEKLESSAKTAAVLIVVNPNNPTGERFPLQRLVGCAERLAARQAWLIVDEAFIDATPEQSLVPLGPRPGLIVLRSLGKFFGLAGARVGFVCAPDEVLERIRRYLGPWGVATPSRLVATHALADSAWQQQNRERLSLAGQRLSEILRRHRLLPRGDCCLFQWVPHASAHAIHEKLARAGILTRLFDDPPSLRFGLPRTETDWQRLERSLADVASHLPSTVSA